MTQTLKDKLRKIMNLAERGNAGERDAAGAMLRGLLEKYHLTVDDLTSDLKTWHWIECGRSKYNKALLRQLYGAITDCHTVEYRDSRTMLAFYCTDMVAVELERQFEFYRKAMEKEFREQKDIIFSAFVQANMLFPATSDAGAPRDLSEDEVARIRAVIDMSSRMKRTTYHKALEQHHG